MFLQAVADNQTADAIASNFYGTSLAFWMHGDDYGRSSQSFGGPTEENLFSPQVL
jgi:hypothetical protein